MRQHYRDCITFLTITIFLSPVFHKLYLMKILSKASWKKKTKLWQGYLCYVVIKEICMNNYWTALQNTNSKCKKDTCKITFHPIRNFWIQQQQKHKCSFLKEYCRCKNKRFSHSPKQNIAPITFPTVLFSSQRTIILRNIILYIRKSY